MVKLRRKWKETDDLSLDKFLDDAADDENGSGFDPTGNTKDMNEFELKEMLQRLIGELMKEGPDMAEAIRFLAQEYTNGEVGQMVKPGLKQHPGVRLCEEGTEESQGNLQQKISQIKVHLLCMPFG